MTKTVFLASLAAFAVTLPVAASAAPANVVVVDNERIYAECNACRSAQASLQAQATTIQARQTALAAPLKTEAQALQAAADALAGKTPDAALQARATAFQTKQNSANQELSRLQQNLQSSQANVLRQINAKLGPAIKQVMLAKGANLAIDMNNTLAVGSGMDVTADVLVALNAVLPSVSVTPGAAATTTTGR
ncbi:OmpH family outer membrane protein [Sphingomonas sp. RB1R13]|uniref:OmpH family outer membrane protein n=1 Tax=Sphingomonas sp. RB1R13 TaxID=3096159 RepID=UPI002FC70C5C